MLIWSCVESLVNFSSKVFQRSFEGDVATPSISRIIAAYKRMPILNGAIQNMQIWGVRAFYKATKQPLIKMTINENSILTQLRFGVWWNTLRVYQSEMTWSTTAITNILTVFSISLLLGSSQVNITSSHAWMPDWTERNSSSALCVSSVPCLWKSHSLSAAVFKTALKTCLRLTTASKFSVPSTFSCKFTTVGHRGGRNEGSLCLEQSWQVNGLALVPGLRLDCSCFTCCQEFLPCPNFYLPGSFTCISSKCCCYFSVSLTDAGPRIECLWNTSWHQDMHYSAS